MKTQISILSSLLGLVTFLSCSGCASPKLLKSAKLGDEVAPVPFLLAHSDSGGRECVLELKNDSLNRRVLLPLDGSPYEAEPGEYRIRRIDCGPGPSWGVEDLNPENGIRLELPAVYYLGNFKVEVSPDGKNLVYGFRNEVSASKLNEDWSHYPSALRMRTRSPYTGKLIPSEMIQKTILKKVGVQANYVGSDAPTYPNVESCMKLEKGRSPLFLGWIHWVAAYENDALVTLEERVSEHTGSEALEVCLRNLLENFEPGVEKRVVYEIVL